MNDNIPTFNYEGIAVNNVHEKKNPLLSFVATDVRSKGEVPGGGAQVWAADFSISGPERQEIFKEILFIEMNDVVSILGIEEESGSPDGIHPYYAKKQQEFIHFLRDESDARNNYIGILSVVFEGHEYSCEGKATAAFIKASGLTSKTMGIGYFDTTGEYKRIAINPDDGWM